MWGRLQKGKRGEEREGRGEEERGRRAGRGENDINIWRRVGELTREKEQEKTPKSERRSMMSCGRGRGREGGVGG